MSSEVLGKGRTAIFRSPETEAKPAMAEVRSTELEVRSAQTEVQSSKLEHPHAEAVVQTPASDARIAPARIDPQILQQALNEADAKSKITIWNPGSLGGIAVHAVDHGPILNEQRGIGSVRKSSEEGISRRLAGGEEGGLH